MPNPLIVTPGQQPAGLSILGEEITVLADGAETGSYEVFRQAGPEGSGPPPHSHSWDEAFYVLEGSVIFGLDNESEQVATAGTFVHVPGGTIHWFRVGDGGAVMLSVTSSTGAAAFFTQMATDVSTTDPDLGALIGIATAHGVTVAAALGQDRA